MPRLKFFKYFLKLINIIILNVTQRNWITWLTINKYFKIKINCKYVFKIKKHKSFI